MENRKGFSACQGQDGAPAQISQSSASVVQRPCVGSGFSAASAVPHHSLTFLCCRSVTLRGYVFVAGQIFSISAFSDIETLLYSLATRGRALTRISFLLGTEGMQKTNEEGTVNKQCSQADASSAQAFWFLLVIPNALSCVLLQILLFFSTNCSDFYPDVVRKFFVCI